MAPIDHLGFHLGTHTGALSAYFINEIFYNYSWRSSSLIYPDFPLQHRLSIKTLIGHKLSDLVLHSPEYLIGTKLSDGHDGFLILLGNSDGLPITIAQLLSKSLLRLLEIYQAHYKIRDDEITYSCCIGIPIYFTHIQRSIVQNAARQAGFTSIALVHETTAAASDLSYRGLLNNCLHAVLVDMGTISMQVSVVKCQKGKGTHILSHAFDSSLGGRAFDMVLLNHFVVKFRDERGIDATNDSDLYWKLYSVCEKMKIELSTRINATFVIRVGDKNLIGSMKREELERMCTPLLERVKGPLEKALDNVGLGVGDIQSVQCVGLASQIPAIIKILTDFFRRNPVHAEGKNNLVCMGCSKYTSYMSQNKISNTMRDIFPFSIAMSWNTKEVTIEGDGQAIVFPKGCPTEDTIKEISFSAALTFSVGFKYSDIADPMIETRIGRFEIGPFQSKTGAKVQGEFTVLLEKDGIFSVESASISEDGKWIKIQVSCLNESQERGEESNQYEHVDNNLLKATEKILEDAKEVDLQVSRLDELQDLAEELNQHEQLDLREKLEKTEHLLIKEREKRIQLEARVEQLESTNELCKIQLKETSNLLETEKEKSTKLEDELTKVKIELEKEKKLVKFSYSELKAATNGFHDDNKIGKGGYGTVYKGVIHCTTVAIKVLHEESYEGEKEFDQEVETLQKVRHPNLVTLIGACREKWALVYEFLPKGNLEECLRNVESRKSLSWRKRIQIASNICSALVFLHHTKPHAIVHGDLKPANIFLDSTYTCKLGDFGTCRMLKLITDTTTTPHHKTEEPRGTIFYFDPEYLETCKLTTHTDVFGYGVVLLQLVTGKEARAIRALVEDAIENGKLNEVVDALANWPLEVAEKMARLGLRCIEWKKIDRPDLANEVWIEVESMEQVASRS